MIFQVSLGDFVVCKNTVPSNIDIIHILFEMHTSGCIFKCWTSQTKKAFLKTSHPKLISCKIEVEN